MRDNLKKPLFNIGPNLLHRRGAFYSPVCERCVTPSMLILELIRVLYKNNKKLLKITCPLKLNLNYLELNIKTI